MEDPAQGTPAPPPPAETNGATGPTSSMATGCTSGSTVPVSSTATSSSTRTAINTFKLVLF